MGVIKTFREFINESIWSDIQDRSMGNVRKEDGRIIGQLEDGTKLTITGNNPVWLPTLNCYRRVDELKQGDYVLMSE